MEEIIRDYSQEPSNLNEATLKHVEKLCADGKSPIVILGGQNTFNIIRTQHNDASAVASAKSFAEERAIKDKMAMEFVKVFSEQLPKVISFAMEHASRKAEQKAASQPKPTPKAPPKKKKK